MDDSCGYLDSRAGDPYSQPWGKGLSQKTKKNKQHGCDDDVCVVHSAHLSEICGFDITQHHISGMSGGFDPEKLTGYVSNVFSEGVVPM